MCAVMRDAREQTSSLGDNAHVAIGASTQHLLEDLRDGVDDGRCRVGRRCTSAAAGNAEPGDAVERKKLGVGVAGALEERGKGADHACAHKRVCGSLHLGRGREAAQRAGTHAIIGAARQERRENVDAATCARRETRDGAPHVKRARVDASADTVTEQHSERVEQRRRRSNVNRAATADGACQHAHEAARNRRRCGRRQRRECIGVFDDCTQRTRNGAVGRSVAAAHQQLAEGFRAAVCRDRAARAGASVHRGACDRREHFGLHDAG
mmetsp:Transcript_9594/g.33718  ORF Transcript_9594/g.33718 Transcript_9594/m.33718 type:complete len:267 (+) Transcript_9594:4056-4856(+)